MKIFKVRILFFGIFAGFIISINHSCQKSGRWSKEWEEWFETPQPSATIMDSIGVKPGMIIGEVGAGNGRLAVKMARRVGESGKVYANDIDGKALNFMRKRIERENIQNMIVVRGEVDAPRFPEDALDLVYIVNTYEHLAYPVELMKNIAPSLKRKGKLVIISVDPVKIKYQHSHATSKETILRQAGEADFELVQFMTFLRDDNIYIFKPKKHFID